MPLPVALRALAHRNFRLFVAGQLTSLVGTWMQMVAQGWLVYRLTGSSLQLGLVGFASQIPVFLLVAGRRRDRGPVAPPARPHRHAVVDDGAGLRPRRAHDDRRGEDVARLRAGGVCSARPTPSTCRPGRRSSIEMVGKADLVNAIALNSSMVNGARLVGPAVSGVLVAAVGEGWCFLLNGVSFLAVIAGLAVMRLPPAARASAAAGVLSRVVEGFGYVAKTPPIRALLLLLGVGEPDGDAVHGARTGHRREGPPRRAERLRPADVGARASARSLGAAALAARRTTRGLLHWTPAAAAGFGVALILFSLSRVLWLSVALLVPAGFCMMVQMASANTLIQSMVPDRLRGRVMAVYAMMFLGMTPFGSLLAGLLADPLGAPATVALGGTVCVVAGAIFAWRLPGFQPLAHALLGHQGGVEDTKL